MRKFSFLILIFAILFQFCTSSDSIEENIFQSESTSGYRMLLMGNSFFRPYAENLENAAMEAGYENHDATVVFRGGDNGRPINFWNDTNSSAHLTIKNTLDEGDIEILGMTAGVLPDNPTDGFKEWIEYAVQKNSNIIIFLSIPPIDFPKDWNERAVNNGFDSIEGLYDSFVNDIIHAQLVEELRAEFPNTKIFTIPTGWATFELAKMQQEKTLLDNISLFGSKPTSIFTDDKGHQGQIVIETGTLIWLTSIYQVDLNTNSYSTGFSTNLHAVARQIMNYHPSNYKK